MRIVQPLTLTPLAFTALLALLGCGKGGGGDPPSTPAANEYGTYGSCKHVSELVGPATWESPLDDMSVACTYPTDVSGVCVAGLTLTAVDTFDETGDGAIGNYYVQDTVADPPPYSGITVFTPTFSPPDLRLFQNDVVDVNGTQEEFIGPSTGVFSDCRTLPELAGTMSFRFDGTQPTAPVTIPLTDLTTYATARQWLGMLVRVENVLVKSSSESGGRVTASLDTGPGMTEIPSVDNELYDLTADGPDLSVPKTFKSVTGIITYFYSFHIAPRSPADFEE